MKTFARAEDVEAADEMELTEALLTTEGVGEGLRVLRYETGDVGICEKGTSRLENLKSMLSSGDSSARRDGLIGWNVCGDRFEREARETGI